MRVPDHDSDARQRAEADLVANRLAALYEEPVTGDFDLAHLRAIHAWLFQDLPHHQPGVNRGDTPDGWIKRRALEGETLVYAVPYVHRGVAARIAVILKRFGGAGALSGRTPRAAARRLAMLYADLDHAHGFYEGNSRTLREFTRSLAEAAGFTLDWIGAGVGTSERNQLYIARDVAVLERAFPGLTEQRAMETDNRAEYEAWFRLERLRAMMGERTLEAIVRERLSRRDR